MNKIALLLVFLAAFTTAKAQNEVMLHLAPRLGNAVFSLNTAINHPSGAYQLKYTRFEYYISEIKITHDGGQVTPVTGMHLLVRPALDSMYSLGQMPTVQNVESITFSVGVEQAFNHLDPASYPANDPLAPQNPSMQWGWTAGYRFAAVEGVAGSNFAQTFEIHALGDANYKTQTLSTVAEQVTASMKMIHLIADYRQVMKSITVSGGLISHGTTGAAVTLLNNFKNIVFTAETSAVIDPSFTGSFSISPNPAQYIQPKVNYSLNTDANYQLSLTDMAGKTIYTQQISAGENQSIQLERTFSAGVYFVHLWQNGRPVAIEKLVILN